MPGNRDRISIILVEPRAPGNIGMTCRAMANFGFTDLRLVNPCAHLHPEAHKFAVFAADLLGRARVYSDLSEATADLHLTVAATRRTGKMRGDPLEVSEAPKLLDTLPASASVGLVFGREDAGLTNEEIALCNAVAKISTPERSGSLNLAQAVLVFLYEFSKHLEVFSTTDCSEEREPATQGELQPVFTRMEEVLSRTACLNPARPEAVMNALRRIHHRACLDREEANLLRGIWDQLAWSIRDWRGRRRGEG